MNSIILEDHSHSEFTRKSSEIRRLINEALLILQNLGIPLGNLTGRRLERMAMAFLAVADVPRLGQWANAKNIRDRYSLRTREIIKYVNSVFGETISSGSYDDIRRKDLELPVLAGIIVPTLPEAARNSAMRGYALSEDVLNVIRTFGTADWETQVDLWKIERPALTSLLVPERDLAKTTVTLPSGIQLPLSVGDHNLLQKAIIEEFLPRFGHNAEVLYLGDTANKFLFLEKEKLTALNFFELSHGELPDVIAYSATRNWLYLIEAVHTSGAITNQRRLTLQRLTENCTADIVYVSAFLTRHTLRRFVTTIAWETIVWIAEESDHLIHFNGGEFLDSAP